MKFNLCIYIFLFSLQIGNILLFQARPCLSKSKAIASEHLSVVQLLGEYLPLGMVAISHGRKAEDEHVLKDWPSKSATCAESATGKVGTPPSQ